jgi:hypothetical protein
LFTNKKVVHEEKQATLKTVENFQFIASRKVYVTLRLRGVK